LGCLNAVDVEIDRVAGLCAILGRGVVVVGEDIEGLTIVGAVISTNGQS
jgi:hypothetical protein